MQMRRDTGMAAGRMGLLLRQRPHLVLALVGAVALLLAAGVFGALSAAQQGGVLLERGGLGQEDARADTAPDASETDGGGDRGEGAEDAAGDAKADTSGDGAAARIMVDVAGAVRAPQVVELSEGSRVQDAIEAAGGLAGDADTTQVNRASVLVDGQKVYIPRAGEQVAGSADGNVSPGGASPDAGVSTGATAGLVNINTADIAALDTLPGIGPATAQTIVEDREQNGAFASIEDLMRVSGIGEKKFEKLKDAICV